MLFVNSIISIYILFLVFRLRSLSDYIFIILFCLNRSDFTGAIRTLRQMQQVMLYTSSMTLMWTLYSALHTRYVGSPHC